MPESSATGCQQGSFVKLSDHQTWGMQKALSHHSPFVSGLTRVLAAGMQQVLRLLSYQAETETQHPILGMPSVATIAQPQTYRFSRN